MRIIELILDELGEATGVDAISIVENPAIEVDFLALKDQSRPVQLKTLDNEKRILLGAALVPDKMIFRKDKDDEFYIFFSKETVRKASEMYLTAGRQGNNTLEHQEELSGLSVVESWIVEDKKKDKSAKYDLDVPVGTWMVAMKVYNDNVWQEYVKTGKVKGFSIEGYFLNKANSSSVAESESVDNLLSRIEEEEALEVLELVKAVVKGDKRSKTGKRIEMETYSDYPQAVRNNAKRGIDLNNKNGGKCATQVGKVRAQQLSQGKPISKETIKRMYSYLSRAEEYYEDGDTSSCGYISYLLWGGKAALRWSESKIKEIEGK